MAHAIEHRRAAAFAQAIQEMLANWNTGLQAIQPSIKHPDVVVMLVLLFAVVIDLVVEMVTTAETRRVVLGRSWRPG